MKKNEFKELRIGKTCYSWKNGLETKSTFTRVSVKRKFVKILLQCLDYTHIKEIYPGVKYPLEQQLRDMCRVGLIARFEKANVRGYYYKTTDKGKDLLLTMIKNY